MHVPNAPREPVSRPSGGRRADLPRPEEARIFGWLFDSGLCDPQGRVQSWLNPKKPGYVYPEIMGYYASLCAERARTDAGRPWLARGQLVGRAIVASLSPAGGLGRAGIDYTFDTGIALCGLARVDSISGRTDFAPAIARMADFLAVNLSRRVVACKGGEPVVDDTSWSLSFGASALKTGIALDTAATLLGDDRARELARSVVGEVVETCFRNDAFQVNARRPWVYAHAHCYAVEGLLALSKRKLADPAPIAPAAAWLARVQNPDGSLTNYHGRPEAELARQGDATSQAVRIWSAVDAERFSAEISAALGFLHSLQTPAGGLRYNHSSQDVNSWVSMFAGQACLFARGEREVEWLL